MPARWRWRAKGWCSRHRHVRPPRVPRRRPATGCGAPRFPARARHAQCYAPSRSARCPRRAAGPHDRKTPPGCSAATVPRPPPAVGNLSRPSRSARRRNVSNNGTTCRAVTACTPTRWHASSRNSFAAAYSQARIRCRKSDPAPQSPESVVAKPRRLAVHLAQEQIPALGQRRDQGGLADTAAFLGREQQPRVAGVDREREHAPAEGRDPRPALSGLQRPEIQQQFLGVGQGGWLGSFQPAEREQDAPHPRPSRSSTTSDNSRRFASGSSWGSRCACSSASHKRTQTPAPSGPRGPRAGRRTS